MRLLLLIVIAGIVYFFWKKTMERYERMRDRFKARSSDTLKSTPDGKLSELVQDPICKLYIAKDSAILYKGTHFCSEKCRREFEDK